MQPNQLRLPGVQNDLEGGGTFRLTYDLQSAEAKGQILLPLAVIQIVLVEVALTSWMSVGVLVDFNGLTTLWVGPLVFLALEPGQLGHALIAEYN